MLLIGCVAVEWRIRGGGGPSGPAIARGSAATRGRHAMRRPTEGRESYGGTGPLRAKRGRGTRRERTSRRVVPSRPPVRSLRLPMRAASAIITVCGVEQLVARRAHNPEVAGSSPVPATSRVVANSSLSANARTTRPPDLNHGGASFALCARISRRCQRVGHRGACLCLPWTSPAGRSTAPARRPKSASVSPSLSLCGCSVTAGQSTTAVPSSTDAPWRRHHPLWRAPQA